jgi:hypothetical protein
MADLSSDPLAIEHSTVDRIDAAITKIRMVVAYIDHDDVIRHAGKQPRRKIGDGLRRDRENNDFGGADGVDNGSGRRADLGRQRGQAVRPPRACNRDVMTELDEAAGQYPPHASGSDDSDSHLDSSIRCREFTQQRAERTQVTGDHLGANALSTS